MKSQTLNLVAKLLANENINVVRAPVITASFDIVGRTLTLPQWKEMTPEIDQMLVAHEVSHALFTTIEYHDALQNRLKFKNASGFLNILEDARIEKLMKRRYPGLRKTFNVGYKSLNDMDFFRIKGKDLTKAHLMDKINLHFKVGYGTVVFEEDEMSFVDRTEQLETIEQTVQLAIDIHNFLKEKEKAAKQQAAQEQAEAEQPAPQKAQEEPQEEPQPQEIPEASDNNTDHSFKDLVDNTPGEAEEQQGEESETESTSESGSESESEESTNTQPQQADSETESGSEESEDETNSYASSGSEGGDADFQEEDFDDFEGGEGGDGPSTHLSFEESVSDLADIETQYKYWELVKLSWNPIISHKEVADAISTKYCNDPIDPTRMNTVREFKRDTQNNVDYLVKEFEMRKAASAYKRSMTSKSGSLDMSKIWSYKLNDDLFKRVTTVKQGKNHGMVFLLDWSGSMHHVIDDTIDQVINLSMFCQRAGISFQVFAFTDQTTPETYYNRDRSCYPKDDQIDCSDKSFALLELFSDKMTASEFNAMISNLKTRRVERTYPLNGTPLNEALSYMYEYIDTFQRMNNVEKVSFITLTDGEGGTLPVNFDRFNYGSKTKMRMRHFIEEPKSKKVFDIDYESSQQTTALIQMIKARYECAVIGFFVTQNSRHNIASALRHHYGAKMNASKIFDTVETLRSDFRSHGYSTLRDTGRDELFVIPSTSTKVQYEELQIDSEASARSIASKFGKYMTTKKTSRILLNKFIGYVA